MGFFDRFKKQKEQELTQAGTSNTPVEASVSETASIEVAEKTVEPTPSARAGRLPGDASRVLISPLLTEKAAMQSPLAKYQFEISPLATKISVKKAVETAFGVHVVEVNIMRVHGKMVRFGRTHGRRSSWKKAIVTLKVGEKIDVYGGV